MTISMDGIYGAPANGIQYSSKPKSPATRSRSTSATNIINRAARSSSQSNGDQPAAQSNRSDAQRNNSCPGQVTPAALSQPAKDTTTALPSAPSPARDATPPSSKSPLRRPGLLKRASSEKVGGVVTRRASWISNLSNKFSSSSSSVPTSQTLSTSAQSGAAQSNGAPSPGLNSASANASKTSLHSDEMQESDSPAPQKAKDGSFFSSLTRKWSAGSQAQSNPPKIQPKGSICERRILNVDPNRQRCTLRDVDPSSLRKVSFCVDVEIASGPRYSGDDEEEVDPTLDTADAKAKERAEGDAFRRPEAILEEEDDAGTPTSTDAREHTISSEGTDGKKTKNTPDLEKKAQAPHDAHDSTINSDKKKEKKKRSEEERKERKEKRRRRAEENGSIPVELSLDADVSGNTSQRSSTSDTPGRPATNGMSTSSPQSRANRPTTDPVRIYRRCCQLRESPILKRITEQLMSPACCVPTEPGVVYCLDLTGSRLQLADMVTLGDWLAVVPVKKLILEDADIPDEGLRCILAGLLAATRPQPSRRRSTNPRHREGVVKERHQERSGVIEKLVLRNNPRISRRGWKHIGLFLYMCQSIKAIDLSKVKFPKPAPVDSGTGSINTSVSSIKSSVDQDASEIFYRCLSERLAKDRLEELIVSECGFSSKQIEKLVDCAIASGIHKLGLADNNIDDEGLEHVTRYISSGVCGGLDLGGNNLQGKLDRLAEALSDQTSKTCWGLSLAGCHLDGGSMKQLFSVLTTLPIFRFIDLSHNRDLCSHDSNTISLLRRYLSKMPELKRLHLTDVGMSAKQAIALADVLAESPKLAHVNLLENPKLTALANAKDESNQEEACALYASYMAAVKVSNTLVSIDIDVPSSDNSEVVKALAKQVVAYSLRNMEQYAIAELAGNADSISNNSATSNERRGSEAQVKEVSVPDVLVHLIGQTDVNGEVNSDDHAPDDDYIVGGTGVVKALQYVLGEKASDLRRSSLNTPISGARSPRPGSSAGLDLEQRGKAKKMSKNLLDSARKIRERLRPALIKEATCGDDISYRRLLFLDQTLASMIARFEEEFPETRIGPTSPPQLPLAIGSRHMALPAPLSLDDSRTTSDVGSKSDEDLDNDADNNNVARPVARRNNSDVSLASRRSRLLAIEEGQLHRLGQSIRREVVESPTLGPQGHGQPSGEDEAARLRAVQDKIEGISGAELKGMVQQDGWAETLAKLGANVDDLRMVQEQDPQAWEMFKESQVKARLNLERDLQSV